MTSSARASVEVVFQLLDTVVTKAASALAK